MLLILLMQIYLKTTTDAHSENKNVVIMISIDGFRYNIINDDRFIAYMPNIKKLEKAGSISKMQPVFPSKTFPNHYSIATGLYPETHGIVANMFYDPELDEQYNLQHTASESKWYTGDPIWNTVHKSNLRSATHTWPGAYESFSNSADEVYDRYDPTVTPMQVMNQILEWLNLPDRPSLIAAYLYWLDHIEHVDNTQEAIKSTLALVDSAIGYLLENIAWNPDSSVHVIIVSDHGMAPITKVINISELLDPECISKEFYDCSTGAIWPKNDSCVDDILARLDNIDGFRAYKKESIPDRFEIKHNVRIAPVYLIADIGICITNYDFHLKATHGYDNMEESMQAIFIGTGERFEAKEQEPILNLDVYSIICEILGVDPSPNNGTLPDWVN
eukprot:TRINITY_DN2914_c0_g1_i4.p2 TRINITY_DN2914_c0_g1~~TRINITY_DN2914_c0_g1_i4.p2  ORF type:complete len:388 (+),score=69.88 TRINITY_DN2914_c0_g1_i4:398-1561(+)